MMPACSALFSARLRRALDDVLDLEVVHRHAPLEEDHQQERVDRVAQVVRVPLLVLVHPQDAVADVAVLAEDVGVGVVDVVVAVLPLLARGRRCPTRTCGSSGPGRPSSRTGRASRCGRSPCCRGSWRCSARRRRAARPAAGRTAPGRRPRTGAGASRRCGCSPRPPRRGRRRRAGGWRRSRCRTPRAARGSACMFLCRRCAWVFGGRVCRCVRFAVASFVGEVAPSRHLGAQVSTAQSPTGGRRRSGCPRRAGRTPRRSARCGRCPRSCGATQEKQMPIRQPNSGVRPGASACSSRLAPVLAALRPGAGEGHLALRRSRRDRRGLEELHAQRGRSVVRRARPLIIGAGPQAQVSVSR